MWVIKEIWCERKKEVGGEGLEEKNKLMLTVFFKLVKKKWFKVVLFYMKGETILFISGSLHYITDDILK